MSELSRPVRIDALSAAPRAFAIEAGPAECAALAARFGLVALRSLRVEAELSREGAVVTARGAIAAEVVQACVATGDDVPARVRDAFDLRFVPEAANAPGEEVELEEGALDTLPYAGGAIDLGEAAAQTLALALDPWPRAPDAEARLRAAGVLDEAAASPFAMLRDLRSP